MSGRLTGTYAIRQSCVKAGKSITLDDYFQIRYPNASCVQLRGRGGNKLGLVPLELFYVIEGDRVPPLSLDVAQTAKMIDVSQKELQGRQASDLKLRADTIKHEEDDFLQASVLKYCFVPTGGNHPVAPTELPKLTATMMLLAADVTHPPGSLGSIAAFVAGDQRRKHALRTQGLPPTQPRTRTIPRTSTDETMAWRHLADHYYGKEEQIPITIDGDEIGIVAERASKSTVRVTEIAHSLYPSIQGPKNVNAVRLEKEEASGNREVSFPIPHRPALLCSLPAKSLLPRFYRG
ncbi:hypothetical protein CF326_g894 [Tilletia indica]|nr:hypothetical protein CF326_g894 [Tilletia indica]